MLYANENGYKLNLYTTLVGASIQKLQAIQNIPFDCVTVHLPWIFSSKKNKIPETYLQLLKEAGRLFVAKNIKFVYAEEIPQNVREALVDFSLEELNLIDRAGNLKGNGITYNKRGKLGCYSCGDDYSHNVLLPDGRVALCCMDYNLNHVIGDLSKDSYSVIRQSKALSNVKKASIDETMPLICRSCYKAVIDPNYKSSLYLKAKYKFYKTLNLI